MGLVAVAGAAVRADHAHLLGKIAVLGQDRTAVAVAAERLGRIEAGGADRRQRADALVAGSAAEALRRIRQHRHATTAGDLGDRGIVGRQAVEVDRHHGARLQVIGIDRLGDGALEIGRVHVEGRRIDIDEDRRGTNRDDRTGGGGKGEGRHEDGVARLHAHRHHGDHQRVAAAGDADRMAGAGECGKPLL